VGVVVVVGRPLGLLLRRRALLEGEAVGLQIASDRLLHRR